MKNAIFVVFAMGTGCSVPPWVDRQFAPAYPEDRYLCEVGMASVAGDRAQCQENADKAALSKLASYFRTRVTSMLENEVRTIHYSDTQKEWYESLESTIQKVSAFSDEELFATRIRERFVDEKNGQICSLAVLDRRAFGGVVQERAQALDAKMGALLREAEGLEKTDSLKAFLLIKKARPLSVELAGLREKLLLGGPPDAPWGGPERGAVAALEIKLIRTFLEGVRFLVRVWVDVDGEGIDQASYEEGLTNKLQTYGFSVSKAAEGLCALSLKEIESKGARDLRAIVGPQASLLLYGKISARLSSTHGKPDDPQVLYFYKASTACKVLNLQTGEVAASIGFEASEKTKEGHLFRSQASSRSLEKALDVIAEELTRRLMREDMPAK
jgi:hypothetical protein